MTEWEVTQRSGESARIENDQRRSAFQTCSEWRWPVRRRMLSKERLEKSALSIVGGRPITPTMSSWFPLRACVFAVVLAALASASSGASVNYRGFNIDLSAVAKNKSAPDVHRAIEEQIDIVHAMGVPSAMMAFFQHVPLEVVSEDTVPKASPGLYGPKRRTVRITSRIIRVGPRPVLLHELLHAYHQQQMPGGLRNREIHSLYEAARKLDAYAAKSHMMQNEREFFACAGTTFLFGVTGQEPFTRDKVSQRQSDLQRFLEKLFGPDAGHYAGSLPKTGPARGA